MQNLLKFEAVYAANHDYVWRCVRRLGVPVALVDDATQEVFVIVHRRLDVFDGRVPVRAWLFGVARKVAARTRHRSQRGLRSLEFVPRPSRQDVHENLARQEAALWVERFLDSLDEQQRAVFVLTQCEGLSVVDAAQALSINTNTAYSRLRLARGRFDRAVARRRACERDEPIAQGASR